MLLMCPRCALPPDHLSLASTCCWLFLVQRTAEDILEECRRRTRQLCEVIGVGSDDAWAMLMVFNWDHEASMAAFLEDEERCRAKVIWANLPQSLEEYTLNVRAILTSCSCCRF